MNLQQNHLILWPVETKTVFLVAPVALKRVIQERLNLMFPVGCIITGVASMRLPFLMKLNCNAFQFSNNLLFVYRLQQITIDAKANCFFSVIKVSVTAQNQEMCIRFMLADLFNHFQASHAWHPYINNGQIRLQLVVTGDGLAATPCCSHHLKAVFFPIDNRGQSLANAGFIIDQQYFIHAGSLLLAR